MGIQGLLKSLEPISTERSLSELYGLRVAVDGYVWLHRGIFSCAVDIARGIPNDSYVSYFKNRIQQLQRYALIQSFSFLRVLDTISV
jgi:exonuclease-1